VKPEGLLKDEDLTVQKTPKTSFMSNVAKTSGLFCHIGIRSRKKKSTSDTLPCSRLLLSNVQKEIFLEKQKAKV
jgi:hypothetical protein